MHTTILLRPERSTSTSPLKALVNDNRPKGDLQLVLGFMILVESVIKKGAGRGCRKGLLPKLAKAAVLCKMTEFQYKIK